jgi:glutamyl-tRNA synthetase
VTGDFVLKRGDGVYAYQLACVVDDLAMGVTEVVRGADLLDSAPRQVLLARLLGGTPPTFAHAPLVVAPDGARLAKRLRGVSLRDHRDAGVDPQSLVAAIATMLGLAPGPSPAALLPAFRREVIAGRASVALPPALLELPG